MPRPGYDYGPPVVVGVGPDDDGTPATTTGETESGQPPNGFSPHTPPANTATVVEPGGSPSEEWLSLNDPHIASLTPNTGAAGAAVAVTVAGSNFDPDSTVEVDNAPVSTTYVSPAQLTTSLNRATAGTVSVTVRNPTGDQESNSVNFTFTGA